MARVIDSLPPRGRAGAKYPMDEWLDGRCWVLLQGEDYRCTHSGMCASLRKGAKERGGVVETRVLREAHEQIGIAFQFFDLSEARNGG